MINLVIDRNSWDRGNGSYPSCMLRNGIMDCMGFLAKACGASNEDINNVTTPMFASNINWCPGVLIDSDKFGKDNSEITSKLIKINDDKSLSDPERENKLQKLFSVIDVNISFI